MQPGLLHHPGVILPRRMQYLDQEDKVVYTAKDKKTSKVFPHPGMAGSDVFTHTEQ